MLEGARSVVRTVSLFEEFSRARRALTSSEIVERLRAPRSSVADLLRTLVHEGVLTMDRRRATYLPTSKFARLGDWLIDGWRSNHMLLDALERLSLDTNETTSFAAPNDLEMEIVHASNVRGGIRWTADVGQRYTLFGSAVGAAHLATLPGTTIRSMYARAQRLPPERGPIASLPVVLACVQQARKDGYAYAVGALHKEVAALGAMIPVDAGPRALYVAIGGPRDRFEPRRAMIEARLRLFLNEVRAQ
ncbi:MAG: helix-turn-helix domain-containing protein [Burkholderiales bacterium]|nr:helix-turn-helix domain-containing protein [Burkholderiales bacterium]